MAIEKWRPAKAGDSGIARVRHAGIGVWQIKVVRCVIPDVGYFFVDGYHWSECEVLVAYLDDAEVEAEVVKLQSQRDLAIEIIAEFALSLRSDDAAVADWRENFDETALEISDLVMAEISDLVIKKIERQRKEREANGDK